MNKLKKILLLGLIVVFTFSFAGCVPTTTQTVTELGVSDEEVNPDMANYEDNLTGLITFMKDSELIAGDGQEMSFDFIGAIAGEKFSYKYNSVNYSCELYEFDTNSLNDSANSIISSVKETGKFKLLDSEVSAIMSTSGKYMMIFTSSAENDDTKDFINRTNEKFTSFHA